MKLFKSMSILALIGFVDSISYMAVAPSLIFYILQIGGTKEQYGLIMSAFSFASFSGKPVYGIWVDRGGNKFRAPYVTSFLVAILGAMMYFLANAYQSNVHVALGLVFCGRLLSGLGGANQALGYAYIASVVPQDQQTKTNTVLAMTRIIGMAIGPAVNIFLGTIDTNMSFGDSNLPVDPLNSVGLLLACGNLFVLLVVLFLLEEPPEIPKKAPVTGAPTYDTDIMKSVFSIEIILPLLILFVVNSSFQLIETALPPAAAHGLGWGPVATSGVLGGTSFVIFFSMLLVMYLSGKVSDILMVAFGNMFWVVGGTGMYIGWAWKAHVWHYVVPVIISCTGFPFIAASNRSNFTKAVASKPELESSQALMQAILSMASSVAGFVTPGLVAAFVLRDVEQVEGSKNHRELGPLALYVSVFPCFILVGLYCLHLKQKRMEARPKPSDMEANEFTRLVQQSHRRSSIVSIDQTFCRKAEVARRSSVEIMGIAAFDTKEEKERRKSLLMDLEELARLGQIDFESDELN